MKSPALRILAVLLVLTGAGGVAVHHWWWTRSLQKTNISPMVSEHQFFRGETAGRRCQEAADCKWPFVCVYDSRVNGSRCLASECATDLQCAVGFVCRAIKGKGGYVRFCLDVGTVPEGERCEELSTYKYESCTQGLHCNRGYCGRPCRIEAPATCPAGMACLDDVNGPSCVPSCQGTICPAGQACVRLEEGLTACSLVSGENCDRTPCPAGEECRRWRIGMQRKVGMWCERSCSDSSGCPPGEACFANACRRPCQGEGDPCRRHEVCTAYGPALRWFCSFDPTSPGQVPDAGAGE